MEKNKNNTEKNKHGEQDYKLHDILIKQHELMLKQYEFIIRQQEKEKEEKDEIDLIRLVPGFLKKKKGDEKTSDKKVGLSDIKMKAPDLKIPMNIVQKFFRYLGDLITLYFKTVKKLSYIVIIFCVLGLGYGIYVYWTYTPVYQSSMVIKSGSESNTFYSGLLFTLENLSENKSYTALASKLVLSEEEAENIVSIRYADYLFFEETFDEDDTTFIVPERPFFRVTVNILDNLILNKLETGIYDYLKNNKYASKRREVNKIIIEESVEQLEKEMMLFDSLKYAVINRIKETDKNGDRYFVKETGLNTGGGLILSQQSELEIDPLVPFERSFKMFDEKLQKKRHLLHLDDDFELIEGFAAFSMPVYPRLRHVAVYTVYGFVLGMVLLFALTFFRKVKKIL